jgi:hypothetical protein
MYTDVLTNRPAARPGEDESSVLALNSICPPRPSLSRVRAQRTSGRPGEHAPKKVGRPACMRVIGSAASFVCVATPTLDSAVMRRESECGGG